MVWLKVKGTAQTVDVQLPNTVKHRSVTGDTLIIAPGLSHEVTDEEWDFIKEKCPRVVESLVFAKPCDSSSISQPAKP